MCRNRWVQRVDHGSETRATIVEGHCVIGTVFLLEFQNKPPFLLLKAPEAVESPETRRVRGIFSQRLPPVTTRTNPRLVGESYFGLYPATDRRSVDLDISRINVIQKVYEYGWCGWIRSSTDLGLTRLVGPSSMSAVAGGGRRAWRWMVSRPGRHKRGRSGRTNDDLRSDRVT